MLMRSLALVTTPLLLCAYSAAESAEPLSFNRDIRPILSENCFHCHGPDEKERGADLRLDDQEAAHEWAIVPGEPDESEVIARVLSDDPDLKMPPPDSAKSVTPAQIETLKQWISEGARYERHWSFEPVADPAPPETRFEAQVRNPIDAFVFKRFETESLAPQPEAERELLLRRASFDLTGLPPTIEELDMFLKDSSFDAFEKAVDRLLASERYGERMAADWLDVARYSDTYGYQVDRDRHVWPWRDWVVRAFNRNMPYDEFITEQLAGDLLPDASREQILATTFNRLHPQKVEGGSVPEEFRIEYVADRTQTVGTAFLGLTMECCRCHDHKYDPIAQAEYYKLSAFFDNIDEAGLYSYFTPSVPTPTLDLPTSQQEEQLARLNADMVKAEQSAQQLTVDDIAFAEWLSDRGWHTQSEAVGVEEPATDDKAPAEADSAASTEAVEEVDDEASLIPNRVKHITFEESDLKLLRNTLVDGRDGKAIQLTGDDAFDVGVGNFKRSQPFTVSLWVNTPDVKERAVIFHRSRAWTDAASRGYQLLLEDGKLSWSLIHFWPGNAIRVRALEPLPIGKWHHIAVASDGSSEAAGLSIFVDGQRIETEIVRDNLTRQIQGGGGDNITIGERMRDRGFKNGLVDEFAVFDRELADLEVRHLFDGEALTKAFETGTPTGALKDVYRSRVVAKESLATLATARQAHNDALEKVQQIMVMRELPEKRPTHVLNRGVYDQKADPVAPVTPAALPTFDQGRPSNRLGLANWMTDSSNPLVSRVAVNRLWQLCFGNGLVLTPEDFGSQGSPPTHPKLLDWLADDFMANGWDIKRTLKLIVTSATYRQSSQAPAELIARDPRNLLLARGPSGRLSAEMLRDNALFVSGLMVTRLGGPPAKPYEVEASFKPVKRDKGEGLYRRSLYTYWKRTSPAPAMMTLDAAKRDVCQVKREKTATPLQAFVLLNGPQYQEAARVTAERLLKESGDDTSTALTKLFRRLTSKQPSDAQRTVLQKLYEQQHKRFADDAEAAKQFLASGDRPRDESLPLTETAALTSVAATLFNYDGCVTKR